MATVANGVKPEASNVKLESVPEVKLENGATPLGFADDDEYEDTGELTMPKQQLDEHGVWLTRIPAYLWEAWSKIGEDEEISLGKVRVYNKKRPDGSQPMKLLLDSDIKYHGDVPKQYDMNVVTMASKNTYIFSEKDQPGYKQGARHRQQPKHEPQPGEKRKRAYATSIPKQTSLVGFAKHEMNCLAIENEEYHQLMEERTRKMFKPKHTTTILAAGDDKTVRKLAGVQPGAIPSFIKSAEKPTKKKTHDNKFIRMSQNELLDALKQCFREYKYWSIKELRNRLQQPESFLKETLSKIAQLTKQGYFTNTYSLLPEYAHLVGDADVKDAAAPDQGGAEGAESSADDSGDGDDDDDEVKMEDVKL